MYRENGILPWIGKIEQHWPTEEETYPVGSDLHETVYQPTEASTTTTEGENLQRTEDYSNSSLNLPSSHVRRDLDIEAKCQWVRKAYKADPPSLFIFKAHFLYICIVSIQLIVTGCFGLKLTLIQREKESIFVEFIL